MIDLLTNLDQTEKYVLMASGAVFALAGIYMMIKPSMRDGETKIEFFGLKFNASSGGLLVFLVGSGFLVGAALAPEKNLVSAERSGGTQAQAKFDTSETNSNTGETNRNKAILLPEKADTPEQEPNNSIHDANQISKGVFYKARIDQERKDNQDWFIIPTSDSKNKDMKIQIRTSWAGNSGECHMQILDQDEQRIKKVVLPPTNNSSYSNFYVGQNEFIFMFIYLHGGFGDATCGYEFKVL